MTQTDTDGAGALLSLPKPEITREALDQALATHWGLAGEMSPLAGERDLNFRLDAGEAGQFLVKLTHPAESLGMTEFQSLALLHVATADPGLPVPRLIRPKDGALWATLPQGRLRVLSWLDGAPMHATPRTDAQAASSGAALARLTRALQGFRHPSADHYLLWDIRRVPGLRGLLPAIPDAGLRAEAESFVAGFEANLLPHLKDLPWQVCHADLNPHNLLVDPKNPDTVTGIIDFGDMVWTPRICDMAVAASYQIDPDRPLERLAGFVAAYTAVQPLERRELALLADLIVARMVTTLTITAWRAARYPENAPYILRNAPAARAGIAAFRALPPGAAASALIAAAQEA